MDFTEYKPHIGVIGLGYVGLPLAIEMGTRFTTVGFDINAQRVAELKQGHDGTLEVEAADFARAVNLTFASELDALRDCNTYIVTVPTPIDESKNPDLHALISASETIGQVISPGDVVIYESTVYPGATEEVCVPTIERVSGLKYNQDFFAGYSPERINPGDKEHRLPNIVKVTSGSTPEAADYIDQIYRAVISAGTHRASSIAVAEAAKVIENTQRDVNIALINELAMVFQRFGVDTAEVLAAAGTKWNFLPFKPGLVGGHCIGVDPYYLTHKAQATGYHPEVILSGRRINDQMGEHIADRLVKLMVQSRISTVGARVLVLGLAFKENCPDIRNTKVVDVINTLQTYHLSVDVHDPWVDDQQAQAEYGIELTQQPELAAYDAVVLAVAHRQFTTDHFNPLDYVKDQHVIYDVKGVLDRNIVSERL
ncbi:MAG: nucleotide sugar dehydrogenase [Pseudomonadales bacterium]